MLWARVTWSGKTGLGWPVGGVQACWACEGPRAWEGCGEGVRPGGFQLGVLLFRSLIT